MTAPSYRLKETPASAGVSRWPSSKTCYLLATIVAVAYIAVQAKGLSLHFGTIDARLWTSMFEGTSIPEGLIKLLPLLAYYSAIIVGAHVIPALFLATCVIAFSGPTRMRPLLVILVTLLAGLSAAAWNASIFPTSHAHTLLGTLVEHPAAGKALRSLAWILIPAGSVGLLIQLRHAKRHSRAAALISAFILVGASLWSHAIERESLFNNSESRPNIIIIGVDSLRPDFLNYLPTFKRRSESQVFFSDTTTPLARTFASWSAVFSGANPVNNGVRFNLFPRESIDPSRWLPQRLHDLGYTTAFATDEVRFANFERSYGFDLVETPHIGLRDFVFGSLIDFAPTNILRNSWFGAILLPDIFANRAAAQSYSPAEFTKRLDNLVENLNPSRPLFLSVHFCTPHWPYMPDDGLQQSAALPDLDSTYPIDFRRSYASGLRATDYQFSALWEALDRRGVLYNAVVVLLSDHGESLGLLSDRLPSVNGHRRPVVGIGHGTVTESDSQYKVVLSLQQYTNGTPKFPSKRVSNSISLIDVAPTILDLVGVQPDMQGMSLVPILQGRSSTATTARVRFRETAIRGGALNSKTLEEKAVASQFGKILELLPNSRLQVKQPLIPEIMRTKQRYAEIDGESLVHDPTSLTPWVRYSRSNNSRWEVKSFSDATKRTNHLREEMCKEFKLDNVFFAQNCIDGVDAPR